MAALRLSFVEEVSSLKWRVESGFNGVGKGTKGTQALRSVEEIRGYATFYGRSTRSAQGRLQLDARVAYTNAGPTRV